MKIEPGLVFPGAGPSAVSWTSGLGPQSDRGADGSLSLRPKARDCALVEAQYEHEFWPYRELFAIHKGGKKSYGAAEEAELLGINQ
jgi:hypothetical protein